MNDTRMIVEETVRMTVDKLLGEMNLAPEIITLSQIKKLYGRSFAKTVREDSKITWFPMTTRGRGTQVYCKKEDFNRFLFRDKVQ